MLLESSKGICVLAGTTISSPGWGCLAFMAGPCVCAIKAVDKATRLESTKSKFDPTLLLTLRTVRFSDNWSYDDPQGIVVARRRSFQVKCGAAMGSPTVVPGCIHARPEMRVFLSIVSETYSTSPGLQPVRAFRFPGD